MSIPTLPSLSPFSVSFSITLFQINVTYFRSTMTSYCRILVHCHSLVLPYYQINCTYLQTNVLFAGPSASVSDSSYDVRQFGDKTTKQKIDTFNFRMSNLSKVLKEFEKDQLEEEKDHENDDDVTGAVLTENDKSHYQSVEKSTLRPVVVSQKYTGDSRFTIQHCAIIWNFRCKSHTRTAGGIIIG